MSDTAKKPIVEEVVVEEDCKENFLIRTGKAFHEFGVKHPKTKKVFVIGGKILAGAVAGLAAMALGGKILGDKDETKDEVKIEGTIDGKPAETEIIE